MGKDDEVKALEGVVRPLIDAMVPKAIKEPKTWLAQMLRRLIREHLGDALYTSILDRLIIDSAEKDPEGTFDKIRGLNVALSNIVYGVEEANEKETDETVQKP